MRLKRISDQTDELISVEAVKIDRGLPLDFEDHDVLIEGLIRTARNFVETKLRGRVTLLQTWLQTELEFRDCMRLGALPAVEVLSVKYIDTDGEQQTLPTTEYALDNNGDLHYLRKAYGKTWPAVREQYNSVEITYTAGHSPYEIELERIKTAMMLIIGHLYETREATAPVRLEEVAFGVDALLDPISLRHLL